jgi:hypothetical protein
MPAESVAAEYDSNRIIETQLDERAETLEQAANADVLSYVGPMWPPADSVIKEAVEGVHKRRRSLMVLVETDGGLVSVAERIALIFRQFYRRVDFVVPTYAMSAGTVLVMSGDAIHMDYASMLGPIDPQVRNREGRYVPALGYLEQYKRFIEKSAEGELTTAELAYFVRNFDQAELFEYEQERDLTIQLLEDWLAKYKFKNWKITQASGTRVTPAMRRKRAAEIAAKLNDTKIWYSHDRGIPMARLQRDLNLLIDDFGVSDLKKPITDYFRLLQDYHQVRHGHGFVLHGRGRHVGL